MSGLENPVPGRRLDIEPRLELEAEPRRDAEVRLAVAAVVGQQHVRLHDSPGQPVVELEVEVHAEERGEHRLVELELVGEQFAEHPRESLRAWVVKFFRLWSRNQWKRERYAPSFHLDDENLDPKTWCRFPILSGGFEEELRELEREI